MFKVKELNLEGVCVLIPDKFEDKRGFFSEIWNKKTFSSKGINIEIVQENQAYSKQSKTIRGLHFQAPPFAQAKLVRCKVLTPCPLPQTGDKSKEVKFDKLQYKSKIAKRSNSRMESQASFTQYAARNLRPCFVW